MTDEAFARAFERGEIPKEAFHHLEHLRLAWAYLGECGTTEQATERMRVAIRRFASRIGKSEKYHETLTTFWMELLASVRSADNASLSLHEITHAHSWLLDSNAPLSYYSKERLYSAEAAAAYLPPDVAPLAEGERVRG